MLRLASFYPANQVNTGILAALLNIGAGLNV